jgi:enamine deaminase RidA (YjgF/YER057c/UK114 family)
MLGIFINLEEVTKMVERDNPNSIHKPVGFYTHVATVVAKKLIFIAGQVPVDKDGKIVGVDPADGLNAERRNRSHVDLAAQVRQTMLNVKEAVESAGGSLQNLVRLDTFVVTSVMTEYRTIGSKAKAEVLGEVRVPGATVFVSGLMIPEAMIEIGAIAAIE